MNMCSQCGNPANSSDNMCKKYKVRERKPKEMKKTKKKALIISVILVIALLNGCSVGNESTGSDNKNTSQSTEVKKPVETEPTATSIPEPTATSIPEPTATSIPEPTATSIPEPTTTSIPEPTATSTPVPTATSIPEPTATSTPVPTATPEPLTINYEYTLYNGYYAEEIELENPTGEYINGIFVLDGLGEKFDMIVTETHDIVTDDAILYAYQAKYPRVGVEGSIDGDDYYLCFYLDSPWDEEDYTAEEQIETSSKNETPTATPTPTETPFKQSYKDDSITDNKNPITANVPRSESEEYLGKGTKPIFTITVEDENGQQEELILYNVSGDYYNMSGKIFFIPDGLGERFQRVHVDSKEELWAWSDKYPDYSYDYEYSHVSEDGGYYSEDITGGIIYKHDGGELDGTVFDLNLRGH